MRRKRRHPNTVKTKGVLSFDCIWTIKRFQSCSSPNNTCIVSGIFASGNKIHDDWCLEFRTYNFHDNDRGYVSIDLRLVKCKLNEVEVKFYLNILRDDQTLGNHEKHLIAKFQNQSTNGFDHFVSKADIVRPENRYLQDDDTLKIYCRIEFPSLNNDFSYGQDHSKAISTNKSKSLSNDLRHLLSNPKGSDVIIIADSYEIPAHNLILSARSAILSSMLKNPSVSRPISNDDSSSIRENNLPCKKRKTLSVRRLELEDISPEVAKKMIEFIYTDDTNNIAPHACELLIAADQYALDSLKTECEKILEKDLKVENATKILISADSGNAPTLKKKVNKFIFENFKEIALTDRYRDLKKNYPKLLGEILEGNLC